MAPPSPRKRGEGRGEGRIVNNPVMRPLTSFLSPADGGEDVGVAIGFGRLAVLWHSSAMPYAHLIVDGYSMIHRDAATKRMLGRSLALARRTLVEKLERNGAALAERITVVFDGRGDDPSGTPTESQHIEVVFSTGGETADTYIERFVGAHPRPAEVMVVTSDRMERDTVEAAGAGSMPCIELMERLETATRETARKIKAPVKPFRQSLGDLL
jgi:predicted RNA-binding protein with PIN domain